MSTPPPMSGPRTQSGANPAPATVPLHGRLRALLAWPFHEFRRALMPARLRWERAWQTAALDYARDVTAALAVRDALRYQAYACTSGGRLPGAVCCDFLLLRRDGLAVGHVIRELRRRARQHETISGPRTGAYSLTEDGLVRLYAARWRRVQQRRRQVEGMPGLVRSGSLRIPSGFHQACQARLAEGRPVQMASSAGLADMLGARQQTGGLLVLLVERAAPAVSHALVVDFCASAPGVFDPHYGFLAAEAATDEQLADLVAHLLFRYEGRAVLALEERSDAWTWA